jgi:hypothetical protein
MHWDERTELASCYSHMLPHLASSLATVSKLIRCSLAATKRLA